MSMADHSQQQGSSAPLNVPVFEEQVEIGKRNVETGRGVRIHKTVSEQPVALDEALLRDAVEVARVPVGRMVADGEQPAPHYEGDTLVVPVLEEVLVVERRVRIKEELRITRSRREQRHEETVVLRSEQVHIERFDEAERTPPSS
jgi:stress response protein YsnF